MLRMPAMDVRVARDLGEALAALDEGGPGTRLVAGGTDMVPALKLGLVDAPRLVSIARIPEARGVRLAQGCLEVGALETHARLEGDALVQSAAPALARACAGIASPPLRLAGTIGGNVCLETRCIYFNQSASWRRALGGCLKRDGTACHVVAGGRRCVASHSADAATALVALGARAEIASTRGVRRVAVADLYRGHHERWPGTPFAHLSPHEVLPHEVLVRLLVPVVEGDRQGFVKLRPRASIDFGQLAIAWRAQIAKGRIASITVVVSTLAARPLRLGEVESLAVGERPGPDVIRGIAQIAFARCRPLATVAGDPDWRRQMVPVLLGRSLAEGLGVEDPTGRAARP